MLPVDPTLLYCYIIMYNSTKLAQCPWPGCELWEEGKGCILPVMVSRYAPFRADAESRLYTWLSRETHDRSN